MQLKTLYDRHQGRCHYCGHPTLLRARRAGRAARATRDHVVPWSRGGRNGDNVVLACARCNDLKALLPGDLFSAVAKALPPPSRFLRGEERRAALAPASPPPAAAAH